MSRRRPESRQARENRELRARLRKLEARNRELEEENRWLRALVTKLEARVAILEGRHDRGPSEKPPPPPPDSPGTEGGGPGEPEERRAPGGQPGHPGVSRRSPTRAPDEIRSLSLEQCPLCDGQLGAPCGHRDHLVEELPPIRPRLIAYRHFKYRCGPCGRIVEAGPHPEEPKNGRLGPRLFAFAALLKVKLGVPYRKIVGILESLGFGRVSPGALSEGVARLGGGLRAIERQILARIRASPAVGADETGWPVGGRAGWMWDFTTSEATLYRASRRRRRAVARAVLGPRFPGTLIADFYAAYDGVGSVRQRCFAHLLREFSACAARGRPAFLRFHRRVVPLLREALEVARHREPLGLDAEFMKCYREDLAARLAPILAEPGSRDPDVKRLAGRLRRYASELLTFLEDPRVDATNNRSERAIRPLVVARKISGGSRSFMGAKLHAQLMSLIQTCHQQGQDFFNLVLGALRAHNTGAPLPSLFPSAPQS